MHRKAWLMVLGVVAAIALAATIPLYLVGSPEVAPHERQLALKGQVVVLLKDEGGNIRQRLEFDNLIVDAGFDGIAGAVGDSSANRPAAFEYVAAGSDGTAAASGNTALGVESARKKGTYSHTAGTKVWTIKATFNPGEATGALREAGVLNAVTGGTLLSRQVFDVVNKGANDTLEITWTFTLSQG